MKRKIAFWGGRRTRAPKFSAFFQTFGVVVVGVIAASPLTAAHAETQAPAGMVPYDHPVYKNGHLVLWHGPSHGGGAPAAPAKTAAKPPAGDIVIIADASDPAERRFANDVAAALGGAQIKTTVSQGAVNAAGLEKAVAQGDAEFALVALVPLLAHDETAPLRAKAPIAARLGAEVVDIVAGKTITTTAALEGVKVDVGPEGSPQAATLATLFDKLGVHPQLQHHPLDAALALLQAGKLDAVASMGAPTPSSLSDFGAKGEFHEVAVSWSPALRGLFTPATITDHERPHLIGAGGSVLTVGAPVALVALGEAGASDEANKAVAALYDGIAGQKAPWDGAPWTSVNFACRAPNWPRAKGLDAWFAAHGGSPDPALVAFQSAAGDAGGDPDKLYSSLLRWRSAAP